MKKANLISKSLLVLCCILFYTVQSYTQCLPRVATFCCEIVPACGSFTNFSPYSPGTYFRTPVLSGASYTVTTCGASIDTEITGFQGNVTATHIFYNDDNGPECSALQASVTYVPNFNEYMRVAVQQFNCLPCGTASITVGVRQNNNLNITSSGADMCEGHIRQLTATPAAVAGGQPNSGDLGTFTGTGVTGNVFTAPTPVGASQVYAITYAFGHCTTTQNITVYKNPTIAAAGPDQLVPGDSTVLAANTPTVGTGQWSVISGAGLVLNGTSPTSDVVGLQPGAALILHWTISNGICGPTIDEVIIWSAPSNNICSGAAAISCGAVITDSTDYATNENEVASCQGPPGGGTTNFGIGVWYKFIGTGDSVELSTDNPGTDYDTELQVWRGSCGALTCIGGDDDGGSINTSIIKFLTQADTTYYVYMDGHTSATGNYELSFECSTPANDSCSNPQPLTMHANGHCPDSAVLGNNLAATADETGGCAGNQDGVWYSFTTGPSQTIALVTMNIISGSHVVVVLDACGGLFRYCAFPGDFDLHGLSPSTTYLIGVFSFSGPGGSFEVCVQEPPPPPVNDLCVNAMQLDCGGSHVDSTTWATDIDVQPVCQGPPGSGGIEEGAGVWFSFTGTGDAMTVSTDNPGTDFDTELALYRGSCDTLTCLGGDDDGGSGLTSLISFLSDADTTYYVYVDGDFLEFGNYEISLTCAAPSNDSCNAAIALPMNAFGHCPDSAVLGNNLVATVDPGGACVTGKSVWYSFTTGPSQTIVGVTLNIISGGLHAVAVYDSCGSIVAFNCALAGDFSLGDLMPSTTYLITVISFSGQGGSFEICVHEPGLPPTNDLCVDATALVCGDHYFGSTFWATSDDVVPVCMGPPGDGGAEEGRGVWYSFIGDGDDITISTDNPGTDFDTELVLYRGSCDTLTCIGGDDDGGSVGTTSMITFLSERDTTYYVYVDGHLDNTGNYELSLSCDCPLFLTLTGSSMNGDDYETSGNLSSDQLIVAGDTVDYDAAVDIDLLLGFEVQLGAVFNAFIDGCNNGGGGDNLTGDDSLDALSKPVQPEWIEAYLEKLTLVKKQNPGLYSEIEKLILQDGFTIQKLKEKGYDDLLKFSDKNGVMRIKP